MLKISIHQDPRTLYPRWGEPRQAGHGAGEGYTVNIPLAKGAGSPELERALRCVAFPVIREFRPQILFRTGGTDMHRSDPLSDLAMSNSGFWCLGVNIRNLVSGLAEYPCVEFLGSGYNETVQASSWLSYLDGRLNLGLTTNPFPDSGLEGRKREDRTAALNQTFLELRKALGWKWKCLKELEVEAATESG